MIYKSRLLAAMLVGVFLSACGTSGDEVVSEQPAQSTPTTNTNTGVVVDPNANNAYGTGLSLASLSSLGIEGDPLNYKVVYFKYNSSVVDERSRVIADAHGRYLQSRGGNLAVTLEGHADERGTRDYNLALGERRAQQVSRLIKAAGARNSVNTISYGEERPIDSSHNDAAWSKNRRVVISY